MAGLGDKGSASSLKERRQQRQALMGADPQSDSSGITLRVSEIAAHPRNRKDLGTQASLNELAASLKRMAEATGNPFLELPTVTTREAHLQRWPNHAGLIGDATHVLVFGHRRIEASRLAGFETVPVKVRDELAGRDIQTMLMENLHRKDYNPLEEAFLYDDLRQRGMSQRTIATEASVSQSHVAKRLKLLALPQVIQDAITLGDIPVIDALTLATLGDADLVLEAWTLVGAGETAREAVGRVMRRQAQPAAESKALQEGVAFVDLDDLRQGASAIRWLEDDAAVHAARETSELAVTADDKGQVRYVAFQAQAEPSVPTPRKTGDGSRKVEANDARAEACVRLLRNEADSAEVLGRAITMLDDTTNITRALPLARSWLRMIGVLTKDDSTTKLMQAAGPAGVLMTQVVVSIAIASDEVHTRRCGDELDARAIAHIERLVQLTEYVPTSVELPQLNLKIT